MTTSIKTCFKCLKNKCISEFYGHKKMKDGHLNKCKECTKVDVKSHRKSEKYRDKVLAYDRARGNRQSPEYIKKYRAKNGEKYRAHTKLNNAIRGGKVSKPDRCQVCGAESRLHGHHPDYSNPTSVVWLCASCHRQLHAA